jgi:hypothetical protein
MRRTRRGPATWMAGKRILRRHVACVLSVRRPSAPVTRPTVEHLRRQRRGKPPHDEAPMGCCPTFYAFDVHCLSWRRHLSGRSVREGTNCNGSGAEKAGAQRKGGAEARLLCDVEPHARSGRSVGAARPFGLWITRSASWFPTKRRRDPGLGPLFNVAWLRRDPNLGRVGTGVQRQSVRYMEPHRPHLTALRRSRQAVAPCTR